MEKNHEQLKIMVIPHFHWDRAWFEGFENFRIGLVEMMDRLLDIFDKRPDYKFTLDGQTVILQDYLDIRPQEEGRLRKHIQEGRLSVGPWYVLPDEKIPSAESHVRNLLIGRSIAEDFGKAAKIGYAPDAFGHISQMPQILQGFGIPSSFFMRGIVTGQYHTEFIWQAPDGSEVTVYNSGYGNAKQLGRGEEYGFDYLVERINAVAENTATNVIGLMAGHDFLEPKEEILDIVNEAREKGYNIRMATVEEMLNEVIKVNGLRDVHHGECPPPEHNHRYDFLPGVLSTRSYLKQENDEAARKLLVTEQACAFASLLEHTYPADLLRQAWEYLIKCHPHDDICGCSKDVVHRDDMFRLEQVQEMAEALWKLPEWLLNQRKVGRSPRAFQQLHTNINKEGFAEGQVGLFVYNPLPWKRSELATATLPAKDVPANCTLLDSNDNPVPFKHNQHNDSCSLQFLTQDIPPCGFTLFKIDTGAQPTEYQQKPRVTVGKNSAENSFLKVDIRDDGTVSVHDKTNGATYTNGNVFVEDEDAGDTYNHSICEHPESFISTDFPCEIKLEEYNHLRAVYAIHHRMRVPAALTASKKRRTSRRVTLKIVSRVILEADQKAVKFATTIVNNAKEHRITVKFPTGLQTEYCFAEGHFDVMQRPTQIPEEMYPRFNLQNYVGVKTAQGGAVLIPRGLKEYEATAGEYNKVDLQLTLLRGTGLLGRQSIQAPKPGPGVATPEAQCLGTQTFYYAFMPTDEDRWQKGTHYHTAYEHNDPVLVEEVKADGNEGGPLPQTFSFLSLPENLVMASCKCGESRRDSIFVRLWNPENHTVTDKVEFAYPLQAAYITSMDEERSQSLEITGNACQLTVNPKQVITLELVV